MWNKLFYIENIMLDKILDILVRCNFRVETIVPTDRVTKRMFGSQGKTKLGHPPPILQIMILKLSPPRMQTLNIDKKIYLLNKSVQWNLIVKTDEKFCIFYDSGDRYTVKHVSNGNSLGTNVCVRNRQVFTLYKHFLHWDFIRDDSG